MLEKQPQSRAARIFAREYHCLRSWVGRGPSNYSPCASRIACIIACILGVGGPGNHSSRASFLACITARILGGWVVVGGAEESQLACTVVRVYHCSHIWEGEARAIIACAHHCSRVSLLASWGSEGPTIIGHVHQRSRVSLPAYLRKGGRAIIAGVRKRTRVSLPACWGGEIREVATRAHHSSRVQLPAYWGQEGAGKS